MSLCRYLRGGEGFSRCCYRYDTLHDHATYALFDPNAMHSFVADFFVKQVGLSLKPLRVVYSISTPFKDKILFELGCSGCKLVVGGHKEVIYLIVIAMYDFDVIIGMD